MGSRTKGKKNDKDNKRFKFSNFQEAPFYVKGYLFKSVEHFYQAMKTTDESVYHKIRVATTPGKAKRMGQEVRLREDWEEIKEDAMYYGLFEKFKAHKHLRKALLDTGQDTLIEYNTWHDNEWGDCICPGCKDITGKNLLGKLLMELRQKIRNGAFGLEKKHQRFVFSDGGDTVRRNESANRLHQMRQTKRRPSR